MRHSARVWLQHLLPKKLLCRAVYRIARSPAPWIKRPLIRWFAQHYSIDASEAEPSSLDAYPSFNAFFTRGLKPDARSLEGGDETVVSPVDGRLTELGGIREGRLLQAKGLEYTLAELLGEPRDALEPFVDGSFITLYLAPPDYHRVHLPVGAALTRTRYIPGRRFAVNSETAACIQRLFSRNERVVCWFETGRGPMVVVLVGALNVSSVSTSWLGEIRSGARRDWPQAAPIELERGAEIGRFNLGSTVVLVFGRQLVAWHEHLRPGDKLRLGTAIGTLLPRTRP
jgi:phosphatidylserine decarboxylase